MPRSQKLNRRQPQRSKRATMSQVIEQCNYFLEVMKSISAEHDHIMIMQQSLHLRLLTVEELLGKKNASKNQVI